MKRLMMIAFSAAVAFAACDKGGGASGAKDQAPAVSDTKGAQPAATAVKPGSHEDWCAGHGVPESQCTRCNSELIADFKAKGDWCEEHGLPESQCLKCNPDLKIERPPKGQ